MGERLDPQIEEELLSAMSEVVASDGADEDRLYGAFAEAGRSWVETQLADVQRNLAERRGSLSGFEQRLLARWGGAIDTFELMLQFCLQTGAELLEEHGDAIAKSKDHKAEALFRLHAKGLLVASEVLALLRTGHASGAMARWRSLHEAAVAAYLVASESDEIARRFLSHDLVESYRADYERYWERLNVGPPDWSDDDRDRLRESLVDAFGSSFLKPFGWAEPLFGHPPKFRQLEERAGVDHLRPYVRMASMGVHPASNGGTWSIQAIGERPVVVTGPSNAGLTDPAHSAAISLAQLTTTLLAFESSHLLTSDADVAASASNAISLQVALAFSDAVGQAFLDVHDELVGEVGEIDKIVTELLARVQHGHSAPDCDAIAAELGTSPDRVLEALDMAVQRGLIAMQPTFRVVDADGA